MNERALRDLPTLKGMWEYMAEIVRPGRLAPGSWGAALVEAAEKGEVDKQLLPALIGGRGTPTAFDGPPSRVMKFKPFDC